MHYDWGYTGEIGPDHWAAIAPASTGTHQSPIVISPSHAVFDPQLLNSPLEVLYSHTAAQKVHNHGRSVQFDVTGSDSILRGGPLQSDEYQLRQFHLHWGSDSSHGAEHKIGDKTYAGELHLVHWNRSQFHVVDEALKAPNGLCVLAVFLEPGAEHAGMDKLCNLVHNVEYAGDDADIPEGFDPTLLLPVDRSAYWTYTGSLTTPPCLECTRFIIFKEPIQVSERQLEVFRSLKCCGREQADCCQHLVDNFRPTMPLNDRKVTSSFRKFFA
jgi:carbonic anhydrase